MCGIVGVLGFGNKNIDVDNLVPMVDSIAYRGPDDAGYLFFHK